MGKIKNYIGVLYLLFCFTQACAQQFVSASKPEKVLEQLKKQNAATNSLQADFQEEKHLSYLKNPQLTSGKFYFQKNDKMRWEQQVPFSYLMIINGEKIIIRENGITKDVSASARMAGKMRNMLLELIRGDFQTSSAFTVNVFENPESYKINLIPKDKRLKNYYQEIHMVFSRKSLQLKELTFLEKKGNRTVTRFYNERLNQKINSDLFSSL